MGSEQTFPKRPSSPMRPSSCTLNVVMHNKYKATRRTTKSCAEHFMSALIFSSDSEQTVGCDCVNTICNELTAPATANRMDGNLCSRSPYLVAVAGGSFTTPVTIQLWNEMVRALRQQQKGHKTSDGYSMVALVRHVANVSVGWGTYCSVIGVVEYYGCVIINGHARLHVVCVV